MRSQWFLYGFLEVIVRVQSAIRGLGLLRIMIMFLAVLGFRV